jgi:cob(I)alamin adenosyltransferase
MQIHHKKMVKVYTKTGDRGTTSLYNGARCPKTDSCFDALGSVDELQSQLGLVIVKVSLLPQENINVVLELLQTIQTRLMDIGTSIATPDGRNYEKTRFGAHEAELERAIDTMTAQLPPLTNFILPGGSEVASLVHICRSTCRRAERCILALTNPDATVVVYMNRLSDYFFTLARYLNLLLGVSDVIYQMKRTVANGTATSNTEDHKK